MSAITATPNADGTVTLNATGMPVLGSRVGTWATSSGFGTGAGTTISDTAGDSTYGSNVQAAWSAGSLSYGQVNQGKAVTVGQYYAFRWLVRLDPYRPDVPAATAAPVEVWLDTTGAKPWGEDKTSRAILWPRNLYTDPDPYGYTELWLFLQANAASETVYLRWRPLYPYVTSSTLYYKFMQFYNNALEPKASTPRIWRTDANGRRELEVPFISAGTAITPTTAPVGSSYGPFVDYEAALEGTVTYELVDTGGGTTPDASVNTALAGVATAPATLSSNDLDQSARIELVTNYSGELASTGKVHTVVDRADPVVVTGPASTRQGTLELFTTTRTDAETLLDVVKAGTELLLRTRNAMDIRLVPQRASDRPAEVGEDLWQLQLDYVEVL